MYFLFKRRTITNATQESPEFETRKSAALALLIRASDFYGSGDTYDTVVESLSPDDSRSPVSRPRGMCDIAGHVGDGGGTFHDNIPQLSQQIGRQGKMYGYVH